MKFQDQIDALEDKEYKKTLDDAKKSSEKEAQEEKEKEKVQKTLDYISSMAQMKRELSGKSNLAEQNTSEDEAQPS